MKNKIIVYIDKKRVQMSANQKLFLMILIFYIAFLFGICVVFREPQEVIPRPGIFRSYRAAWNGSHLFPFAQNIIYNMILYTPVGFLLCGGIIKENRVDEKENSGKDAAKTDESTNRIIVLRSLALSMLLGFAVSISIEGLQMQLHRGTYETDDILNNTFGTLLGASWLIMIKYKQCRNKLIWVTIVFFSVCFVLLSRLVWLCYLR